MITTFEKFKGKENLIKEYNHWYVLLRPDQVTLGSLVLLAKDKVANFSELSSNSFRDYEIVIKEIEFTLQSVFQYNKINYCMYMMVDPDVHFHVFPRYEANKEFGSFIFKDYGWPGMPEVLKLNSPSENTMNLLRKTLIESFK
jgi:diadenosine tetraphosphate (Ap4A) HIT family hydrolase